MRTRVLLRLGIVVVTAALAAFCAVVNQLAPSPPDPVVTTVPMPGLGVLQQTYTVDPSLAGPSMTCTYELLHDDGRRIALGLLSGADRPCELQGARVDDKGALIVMSNIGYIVWRDDAPIHVIREDCRLRIADAANLQGGVTCLFAFKPRLELGEPGEAGETWRLLVKGEVQFTSTDQGTTWQPTTTLARLR